MIVSNSGNGGGDGRERRRGGGMHILENGKEISYLYFFAPVLAKIFTADFFIQNNFSVCQAMRFLN